jgi:hypothetical protein
MKSLRAQPGFGSPGIYQRILRSFAPEPSGSRTQRTKINIIRLYRQPMLIFSFYTLPMSGPTVK